MTTWEAPAKLNLSLELQGRGASGLHPLRSLAQTIEWCDHVRLEESDEDALLVDGFAVPEGGENLVWQAVDALVSKADRTRPRLQIDLTKRIAVAAGLGGGSSDAAAALLATQRLLRLDDDVVAAAAPEIGSDVPYLLVGGLAQVGGHGEVVGPLPPVGGFAVAVVVPPLELSTAEVYRAWDEIGEPRGAPLEGRGLPPSLRQFGPLRNDLTPAAVHLEPSLGDLAAELARAWEAPVSMTGSGPALFAYFGSDEEAAAAARAVPWRARASIGCGLRASGPAPSEE